MRSKLFVPASRPELFAKAMASAADAISFDLEDAVAPERKSMARATLQAFLQGEASSDKGRPAQPGIIVRVNAPGTEHFEADLQAIIWPSLDMINLPMVESAETVQRAAEQIERLRQARGQTQPIRILANIESPRGLRKAADIASAHPDVMGLQIGYGDLFAPLGIASGEPSATQYVRTAVRLAAGEAGIAAYDGAYVNFKDVDGYRRDSMAAHALGFAGRSCIHPSQIEVANQVFMPTQAQFEQALKVLKASEQNLAAGIGAFSVDGRLVDGPFIAEAQALVALGRRLGLPG